MRRLERFAALGALVLFGAAACCASPSDDQATLAYTYRADKSQVGLLTDKDGKQYLPLVEAARFYGVDVSFDPQTRKVTLTKGGRQVKVILSQPFLMLVKPEAASPIDPLKFLGGELAVPVESSADLFGAVLNINARYLDDDRTLVLGGVRPEDIRQEVLRQAQSATPTPRLVLLPAPTPTPAQVLAAAPTPTPQALLTAPATASPTPEEEADETPAPIPGQDSLPPPKEVYQVRRIIIDAGHGGIDHGATGYDKKYCEKQATLDIAKRVAALLEKDPGLQVFLTRKGDYYITLKYRTTFANQHDGDLFVSIHCNANPNKEAYGTETYFYSTKASNRAAEVEAVHENGEGGDIDSILNDLHNQAYRQRSYELARLVDAHIRAKMGQHIRRIQQAPFYVLARVNMPSILIETAFITNPKEEDELEDPDWRDRIAHAIASGIQDYRSKMEGILDNESSDD